MTLAQTIQIRGDDPLLLFGFALVLCALHALELVHSKTMMAAHSVTIKGNVCQAMLRSFSAALRHPIIVWVLAFAALTWSIVLIDEKLEPRFMMVSGVLVLATAFRILHAGFAKLTYDDRHHEHDELYSYARVHAADIEARLADGSAGTWQTNFFVLSCGMFLCPLAITVFILCMYLAQLAFGFTMVSALFIELVLIVIGVGVVTASGLQAFAARSSRFDTVLICAHWGPAFLILASRLLSIWAGRRHLNYGHAQKQNITSENRKRKMNHV